MTDSFTGSYESFGSTSSDLLRQRPAVRLHQVVGYGLMAAALFSFASCSSSSEPRSDPRDTAIQQLKEDITGLKAENQHLKEESAGAQHDASKWSILAIVAVAGVVVGAVLFLVVGNAMGSRTRRDFQHRTEMADRSQGEEAQL